MVFFVNQTGNLIQLNCIGFKIMLNGACIEFWWGNSNVFSGPGRVKIIIAHPARDTEGAQERWGGGRFLGLLIMALCR